MPDSKKTDLTRTFTEQESGIVDPYAESIRIALEKQHEGTITPAQLREIEGLPQAADD